MLRYKEDAMRSALQEGGRVPLLEVESALRTMARTFKLVIAVGACQSCRRTDATFSVAGPVT